VEKPRDRTLTDEELKAIWKATDGGGEYDRIVRLCLLTGCRREEIGGLRWDEVHDDQLKIGTERMKGGIAHEVPLLPAFVETLPVRHESGEGCVFGRRGTGFSGWSKSKRALDAKLAKTGHCLTPWTLHDLRRTFSTRLHDAGIEPLVVEALLAHKQQGVAAGWPVLHHLSCKGRGPRTPRRRSQCPRKTIRGEAWTAAYAVSSAHHAGSR
jgi:integrase